MEALCTLGSDDSLVAVKRRRGEPLNLDLKYDEEHDTILIVPTDSIFSDG